MRNRQPPKKLCSGIVASSNPNHQVAQQSEANGETETLGAAPKEIKRTWLMTSSGLFKQFCCIYLAAYRFAYFAWREIVDLSFWKNFFVIWESPFDHFFYWRCSWGGGKTPHKLQGFGIAISIWLQSNFVWRANCNTQFFFWRFIHHCLMDCNNLRSCVRLNLVISPSPCTCPWKTLRNAYVVWDFHPKALPQPRANLRSDERQYRAWQESA